MLYLGKWIYFSSIYKIFLSFSANQDGRVVKALDLSSNGGIPAWVRTSLLVIFFIYSLKRLNWGQLERRVGSLFFTAGNTFKPSYWLRRGITKMFYIRNPKIYEWTLGFIYGENKIYRSNNMPGTAPSFSQQFEVSSTLFIGET